MKKILTSILTILLIVTLTACAGASSQTTTASDSPVAGAPTQALSTPIASDFDADDTTVSVDSAGATVIRFEGDSIRAEGSGVNVDGTSVTVTAAGVYSIQGVLDNGQIIVDTQDAENVTLILNGATITNASGAPIYVANAEKVILTLAGGTQNAVTDGASYASLDENGEPNAAIFSHDDLTINGNGALTVTANYNNGIASKDDLKIVSGTITVNAANDGIKGKDSVSIKDGVISINAGADGIQTTNVDEAEKGYILIEGGTLNIVSGLDAIQSATSLQISGGNFAITSGGGAVNNSVTGGGVWGPRGMEGNPNKPAESAKGLKAGSDLFLLGGSFDINSADDSLHSNTNITIDGGNILMKSGDDGMHADTALTVNGGEITLTQSYEGMESATITVNGGTIHLTASDDGINAGGGADGSAVNGRPGQGRFAADNSFVYINGGYLYVDAGGDGLDTNGSFAMTNGTVIVNGPTDNGNGPVDYMGTFTMSGGFLVAVGSSGMAQAPSADSTQYSVLYNFETVQSSGTLLHIRSQTGQEILTLMPTKDYQSVMISSPALQNGETYLVYTGGSSSGAAVDGLYSGGAYSPGSQVATVTLTGVTTYAGASGGFGPGGGGGGGQPPRP